MKRSPRVLGRLDSFGEEEENDTIQPLPRSHRGATCCGRIEFSLKRQLSDEELSQIRDDSSVKTSARNRGRSTASYFNMYRSDMGGCHSFFQTSRSSFNKLSRSCPDEHALDLIIREREREERNAHTIKSPSPKKTLRKVLSPHHPRTKLRHRRSSSRGSACSFASPKLCFVKRLVRRASSLVSAA